MPSKQDTTLTIKQTLDIDPEINFINWELNVQDVASTTGRTIAGAQGLLGLVLNAAQWNAHALNISVNDEGQQVIAQRYAAPAYVELDADMSATEITITKARNKIREDWMIALTYSSEQLEITAMMIQSATNESNTIEEGSSSSEVI